MLSFTQQQAEALIIDGLVCLWWSAKLKAPTLQDTEYPTWEPANSQAPTAVKQKGKALRTKQDGTLIQQPPWLCVTVSINMDLIVVFYFIIVRRNEISPKELLILQGASTFPAPEGFYFWERANRQQQFQQDIPLCSFVIKRFAAKNPTKPRGLQALHCTMPVFAMLSSPTQFHYAFLERRSFIPAQPS